jgi:hypothetical protein
MDINIYTSITLQNPDKEGIEIRYDGQSYGVLEPGTQMTLPYFLADHVTKHLINQILNRLKIPLNNQIKRDEWRSKIVINEDQYRQSAPLTQQQILQKQIDELNARNPATPNGKLPALNGILGKKREDAPALPEDPEDETPAVATPSGVQSMPSPVEPVAIPPVVVPVVESPVNETVVTAIPSGVDPLLASIPDSTPTDGETDRTTPPTREQLYSWMTNELKMNLNDEKTMTYLEAHPVEDLIAEFNYFEMKA